MYWDIAPEGGKSDPSDATGPLVPWPTVLPVQKPKAIRRVGKVKSLAPRKNLGLLIDDNGGSDALFTFDDVVPADRAQLTQGQTVTFIAVIGCDGVHAKQVRIDSTTLPPPPPELLFTKGWR
jgi:cold shock CspA family protein